MCSPLVKIEGKTSYVLFQTFSLYLYMKKFNSFLTASCGRLSLAVVALCAASNAWADNKLYIEDFAINPGETKTIEVLLENDDPISGLQFDVDMPEGLEFLEGTVQRNPDRITRGSHTISFSVLDAYDDIDRFVILENATDYTKSALKMNEGALFTIDVRAAKTFKKGDIQIFNIVGSNNTTAEAIELLIEDYTTHVDAYVGTYSFSAEEVTLDAHGGTATIDFNFSNEVAINGIELDLVIPTGVQLVEDAEGELFSYTDRLNINHVISSLKTEEGYRVVIGALTSDNFSGNEGALFSFTIQSLEDAPESLVISAKNVKVSNIASASYNVYSQSVVNVTVKETLEDYIIRTNDVNEDQEFDIDDVQALLDLYFENGEIVADVNGDGEYDIDDVQALLDKLFE